MEEKLLRVLVASPTWRLRAASELKPELFRQPAFRAVFEALVALPQDADVAGAGAALPEAYVPAFQALLDAVAAMSGLNLDREYEGAAANLHDRAEFRRDFRITDQAEKQRIFKSWTPEKQRRWTILSAQARQRGVRAIDGQMVRPSDGSTPEQ